MTRSQSRLSIVVVLLALLAAASLSGRAAPSATGPAILLTASHAASPGSVVITGAGFTPGGRVDLVLSDRWGVNRYEARWTTASPTVDGVDGSQDPARGFFPGGTVSERFDGLCGATLMARAFDGATQTWSAAMDVEMSNAGTAVYGPDGSQDPALGYRPAC